MTSFLKIEEPALPAVPRGFALWQLGFRPFYLLASSFAALSIALWALQFAGVLPAPYLSGPLWHAHEMLFGFTLAVIVGFLFTAGRNWTGRPTPTGWKLAALALLWLLARILVLTPRLGLGGRQHGLPAGRRDRAGDSLRRRRQPAQLLLRRAAGTAFGHAGRAPEPAGRARAARLGRHPDRAGCGAVHPVRHGWARHSHVHQQRRAGRQRAEASAGGEGAGPGAGGARCRHAAGARGYSLPWPRWRRRPPARWLLWQPWTTVRRWYGCCTWRTSGSRCTWRCARWRPRAGSFRRRPCTRSPSARSAGWSSA